MAKDYEKQNQKLEKQNKKLKKKNKRGGLVILILLLIIVILLAVIFLFDPFGFGNGMGILKGGSSSAASGGSGAAAATTTAAAVQTETTPAAPAPAYVDVKVSGGTLLYNGAEATAEDIAAAALASSSGDVLVRITDDSATQNAMETLTAVLDASGIKYTIE